MNKRKKMDILYEDKELLVINKPAGLLTIATEKEMFKTLYHQAREYVKKQNPKNKIFIVHRLDKDTSGLIVFAKNEKVKKELQDNWNKKAYVREYLAIVEGKVKKKKGKIESYLLEDRTFKVCITSSSKGGLAVTHYETLAVTKSYSLLRISIDTGKKNQIRVQLSSIGHPIIGDKKYGSKKNPLGRIGLHASVLKLKNKKEYSWFAKIPKEFKTLFESAIETYEKLES